MIGRMLVPSGAMMSLARPKSKKGRFLMIDYIIK
jgi:hypothetical protein